ncbi:hydroxypyruvate isomerase family protein [Flexivirga meconopsidis]|uniref:hydroxypyruvate isomerase family protein n=1 Tax=Flexivirga meconopsidis TaxID=2977121 RepID=UPI002240C52A|nr:TIM barrel protein [Flexivirga meconopsidis]
MTNTLRPWVANISMLFADLPFLARPAAAAAAGFTAVECWWPWPTATPTEQDRSDFVTAIEDARVQLTGLNFFAGDMLAGERGIVCLAARRGEWEANLPVVAALGERLGCRQFNALYGNRAPGEDPATADAYAVEALAAAGAAVAEIGGTVLIEPVSGSPTYPVKTAADAVSVIDSVAAETGTRNLGFLCDLYHLATNGDDLTTVVERYGDRVAHVQVADAPGRGEPGTGVLDLDGPLDALAERGYRGRVALEYKPIGDTARGLDAWLPRENRAGTASLVE